MEFKFCNSCNDFKPLNDFYKNKYYESGYHHKCKECHDKLTLKYKRSIKGLIAKIYSQQRRNTKERKHPLPSYNLSQFYQWVINQNNFNELYDEWVKSDYDKMKIPSCDRIDPKLSYTFNNLRLVTWSDNANANYNEKRKKKI